MTAFPPPPRKPFCLWKRVVRLVVLVALTMAGFLVGCQNRLIYFPQPYEHDEPAGFLKRGGSRIDFTTGEGHQSAWLIPPRDGAAMERLWIVCNGNASTALGMESWSRSLPFRKDAFLLFDYPGYGACEGSPHPSRIRESLHTVIPLAAKQLQMTDADLHERTCVFGHSLGCAAALIAVEEFHFRQAVLVSPFTSTMEMARVRLKLPLGFLVWHRFDNRTGLACLKECGGHAWVFHGTADRIIPVEMSRTLAAEFPDVVSLQEFQGADHNGLLQSGSKKIIAAMMEARR
jgi:pimeloyl-ACP methyl ester carboxylesterase